MCDNIRQLFTLHSVALYLVPSCNAMFFLGIFSYVLNPCRILIITVFYWD